MTCALITKYYAEENISQRSCTTIRHVIKMLGSISETLIFFFLGVVTVTTKHEWNWAYILFTLLFAFVWRGLGKRRWLAELLSSGNNPPFMNSACLLVLAFPPQVSWCSLRSSILSAPSPSI